ncbi:hypothetical protein K4L06_06615 [Lysobacter sp. BMK333-48F3]|uniref:hypothetical protein n=1 Tax=Lysobacter sp. BMK333-48F3 TaxID=2867962 RepID=UPI001C8C0530|nr:hypothetical protein [Lysobacter sp. BMK333-48F3]MBX9400980.1 hypothetical protein [Lysobacter sp. BMK333-48F3]
MRISSVAAAAALGLAAAFAAAPAPAQQITFPAPVFRGGNTDWQVKLTTAQDLSVGYELQVPQASKVLTGPLQQQKVDGYGRYTLAGKVALKTTVNVSVQLAPVKLGDVCKDNKGNSRGPNGQPYSYAIQILDTGKSSKMPLWYGCGYFAIQ